MTPKHTTANASYYNSRADYYDEFNEATSKATNAILERLLKEHNVSTVLDLTCGTGSQVFWLADAGFEVVGVDLSPNMINIAKQKAESRNLNIKFLEGDCRNAQVGSFDSVITIFNSIGHLTREDFTGTIRNINNNLKSGGLYIFDIFNLDIDSTAVVDGKKLREIQFSTISNDGILASYSTYVHEEESGLTKISEGYTNTLQVYTADELRFMLEEGGFTVLSQTDISGEAFSAENTERVLTLAKKIN